MPVSVERTIVEELVVRISESLVKHGDWSEYSVSGVFEAVAGEFDEYREAFVRNEVVGRHGQIEELYDLAVTAVKGIRRLAALTPAETARGGRG